MWTLTSGKYAMSGHVVIDGLSAMERILAELHARLHERFGLDHTTIQPERPPVVTFRDHDGSKAEGEDD